jgi:lysozyme
MRNRARGNLTSDYEDRRKTGEHHERSREAPQRQRRQRARLLRDAVGLHPWMLAREGHLRPRQCRRHPPRPAQYIAPFLPSDMPVIMTPRRRPPSRLSPLGPLAALVALGGCVAQTDAETVGQTSQALTVCAAGTVVNGVDVSVYQGSVSWSDVKAAGMDFAIARISDGTDLDTEFATNWTGMKTAGLVRGAYQYFEPGDDPATQASIVVSAVGMLGAGDLPVTADMETTGGQSASTIAANLKTWAAAVQAGTGKAPMIYTAEGYWDSDVASTSFASNPLWVANWEVTCPDLPSGWSNWSVWQFSDTATVNGISGQVDQDEYNGTLAELQAFAGGGSTTHADAGTTGTAGVYGATYVSESWPLATTALAMTTCQTLPASITLKNTGTKSWDSHTRLATTQPRNRVSVFADSSWVADDRPAEVTGTVAPGDTFEFKFNFHAPPTTGSYKEYFGMVEDGVVWFSDPGQGGPADDDIEANIEVTAGTTGCTPDQGVPDAGAVVHDGGTLVSVDSGHVTAPGADAGGATGDAGTITITTMHDGGAAMHAGGSPTDAGRAADAAAASDAGSADAGEPGATSGCSCDAVRSPAGADGARWALAFFGLVAARRKRR